MTEELKYALPILYCLGYVLLSTILLFIESYVTRHFQPTIFRVGVRIYRETRRLPVTGMKSGSVFETENGRFKVIARDRCLFFSRSRVFFCKWGGLRGSLQWTENGAMAVVRISVYYVLSDVFLLTLWPVYFLNLSPWASMARLMGTLGSVFFMLVILVVLPGAVVGRRISFAKREAEKILAEYEKYVTGQHGEAESGYQWAAGTSR